GSDGPPAPDRPTAPRECCSTPCADCRKRFHRPQERWRGGRAR
ncbi:MAG: hypothetical protein EAS49_10170, partial [Brucella intermedia]